MSYALRTDDLLSTNIEVVRKEVRKSCGGFKFWCDLYQQGKNENSNEVSTLLLTTRMTSIDELYQSIECLALAMSPSLKVVLSF